MFMRWFLHSSIVTFTFDLNGFILLANKPAQFDEDTNSRLFSLVFTTPNSDEWTPTDRTAVALLYPLHNMSPEDHETNYCKMPFVRIDLF